MSALVATDLDRTLVYSRRSAGPADPSTLLAVEDQAGVSGTEATTWLTRRAADLLAELDRRATWVPATTRTLAELRRLRLPGNPRYTVCAHGGTLLVDGEPDAGWTARVRRLVAGVAGIDEVALRIERVTGPVRRADGLFLVAPLAGADGWVGELAGWASARGWRVHAHGAKLYALPDGLTKTAAVEEIARREPAEVLLAAGDSLLDADLLLRADAAIRPAHGELHDLGWHAGRVAVTAATGVGAGEEIARRLLDHAVGGDRLRPPAGWASCR